jgi:hypothetical protein
MPHQHQVIFMRNEELHNVDLYEDDYQFLEDMRKKLEYKKISLVVSHIIEEYKTFKK